MTSTNNAVVVDNAVVENNAVVNQEVPMTQLTLADVQTLLAQQKAELEASFEAKLKAARSQAVAQASVKIPVRVETSLTRKLITLGVKTVQTVVKPVEHTEVFVRTKGVESVLQAVAVSSDKVYDVAKKLAGSAHTSADARKQARVNSENAFKSIQDAQVALKAAYEKQMLELQAEAEAIAKA